MIFLEQLKLVAELIIAVATAIILIKHLFKRCNFRYRKPPAMPGRLEKAMPCSA
jgi:hypothetical protein